MVRLRVQVRLRLRLQVRARARIRDGAKIQLRVTILKEYLCPS